MDGGRRNGNSTAIDGLMAGTAMDDATATQWRWTAGGNGWQWTAIDGMMVTQQLWTRRRWTACWLDSNGRIDGNGRRWTAHRRRWTVGVAMDSNGQRDSQSMAMDSTAMDSEGLLDGDSTGMDDEERRECDGDGPRAQR